MSSTEDDAATRVIAAIRSGHDDLVALVAGWQDEELTGPSGASEWTLAQVLSHLGSGAEIARGGLEAAIAGAPSPGQEANAGIWARWDAMTPREQADGFVASDTALVELYESLDDATRADLRIDLGFLPAPVDVATAAGLRLRELALHAWDLHVASDAAATVAPEAAEQLLHAQPDLTGFVARPDALEGATAVIAVTTAQPASEFALLLGEQVAVELGAPADPDGTLVLPAEAWLRLASGRLSPDHTPDDVIAGGATDLDLLRRVFPGY